MKIGDVKRIGVVGGGQMGRGIAQVAAASGISVDIYDISAEILETIPPFIEKMLLKGVKSGRCEQQSVKPTLERINLTCKLENLAESDLIIEAATENRHIKFDIFSKLDKIAKKEAIFASNTSSISITEIAAVTSRASQVVGMHFMNPVPIMKLVEGIKGSETSKTIFELIREVAKKMGKTFIEVKDIPGFAINRILMPMINEAIFCLYEGIASATDIDIGMKLGTNQPMGPLELADFIGLDTCLAIMEVLHQGLGDSKYRPCPLLKQYVAAKRFGRKTKRGFYEY